MLRPLLAAYGADAHAIELTSQWLVGDALVGAQGVEHGKNLEPADGGATLGAHTR